MGLILRTGMHGWRNNLRRINKMKKTVSIFLVSILLCSIGSLGGCSKESGGVKIDPTKSQIYIGNYDGGVGSAWLSEIAKNFESKHVNTPFEEGKTGVQVIIDNSKNNDGGTLASLINTSNNEIWFTEQVAYYSLLNSGVLLDITDWVTEDFEEYDLTTDEVNGAVSVSIEDKLEENNRNYFKTPTSLGEKGEKYYGLPFYDAFYSMFYDIDLFEENNLFMKDGGGWCIKETDVKSKGPDNILGTEDDGLPATYDEFFSLMTRMKLVGVTPFVWSGAYIAYVSKAMVNLWADYEGYEQMMLNVTLEGDAKSLVDVDAAGNIIPYNAGEAMGITNENAYLLSKQEGRYHALRFLREVMNDADNINVRSFQSSFTHLNAQDAFLYPRYVPNMENCAILIDGTWWESEATATFNTLSTTNASASKTQRRFGILPLPKATADKVGEKTTLYNMNSSACMVSYNVKPAKYELIKQFIQYLHSNEGLSIFNRVTSMTRPFDYTLESEQLEQMSHYGKTLYEYTKNADIVYPLNSQNKMFLNNETYFNAAYSWSWNSIVNKETIDWGSLPETFKNKKSMTAATYFNGLYEYQQTYWSTFKSYFN